MELIEVTADTYVQKLDNGKTVAVGLDEQKNIWTLLLGNAENEEESLRFCLSNEAMQTLVALYAAHMKRKASRQFATWNFVIESDD